MFAFPSTPYLNLPRVLAAGVPQKALRDRINRLRFGTYAPLTDECIMIDPLAVHHVYLAKPEDGAPVFRRRDSGRVLDGNWDLSVGDLSESRVTRSCERHFVDGESWDETGIIAHHLSQIARQGASDGMRTEEEVRARYDALDHLYREATLTGGFRPRRELPEYFRREHGGVLFHIARDGSPLRAGGGKHRFAIARILKLKSIPAQLGVIHKDALYAGHLERIRQR